MAGQTDYETYYVPDQSRLAFCMASAVGLTVIGVGGGINSLSSGEGGASWYLFYAGLAGILMTMIAWFRTTIGENLSGINSAQLKNSYRLGMQWFIFSEVMFFGCFFGALFYVRNLAGPWLSGEGVGAMTNSLLWQGFEYQWPQITTPQDAVGITDQPIANNGTFVGAKEGMHPTGLPLINTFLLLSSSVTCHFAHHALKENHRAKFNVFLFVTLVLGFVFLGLQVEEYAEAYSHMGLKLTAGIYGSTFFMLTGFHGFHVCMGAIMLTVQWLRSIRKQHFTPEDHFGFEASSWYWHFVDVVWVGLFLFVYIL